MRIVGAGTSAEISVKLHARARRRPWLRSAEARHQAWGYVFLAPMFVLLVVFKFIPMLQAFYLSLTSYDLLSPPRFVGLRNYASLLEGLHQEAADEDGPRAFGRRPVMKVPGRSVDRSESRWHGRLPGQVR